ncbi:hypothetical protein R538_24225, partial [Salmonella enterica subsp. enterica serovar Cerro]
MLTLTTRRRREDGSIPVALLFIVIATALLLAIAASVYASQLKSRGGHDYVIAGQAADAGVQQALFSLNNSKPISQTSSSPTTGTFSSTAGWSVYMTPTPGTAANTSFDVTSTGTSDGVSRGRLATITGTPVYSVSNSGGS